MSIKKMDRENRFRSGDEADASLQKEIEEALGGKSIEELVDEEDRPAGGAGGGRKVIEGTVVSIHRDDIFVDYGGRGEGLLSAGQFDQDEDIPAEGDRVNVVVEGFDRDAGLMRLSREGHAQAIAWDEVERGQIVEGMVTGKNAGGLEMKVQGVRAFMPVSQVDIGHVEDLEPYIDTKLQGVVQEVDRGGKNLVLSRKVLLERMREEQAAETWDAIHVGKVVSGTVRNIMPYGAFVDIGGVDGLLHVRDMAHGRVDNPEDIVHVGQKLEVKILSVDTEGGKIGLGLKQTQLDPWEAAEAKWPPGTTAQGRVTKLADFGAFVELEPGLEALIPVGELSYRYVGNPRQILSEGDTVKAVVLSVDVERQRMSLSLKQAGDDPWEGASIKWPPDTVVEGTVNRITDFGAFVEIAPGVEGLVHISEIADRHVTSVRAELEEGTTVGARVLSVDEDARRMSLSIKKVDAGKDAAPAEGTFDDLAAVKQRDEERDDKDLKGGLGDAGGTDTPFGKLNLG